MLEITEEHIKKLEDDELESLIGRLCEAELRKQDIPTKGVTWGGNQDAKDGGIDVRVDISSSLHSDRYIPNKNTGIQVKKSDMPRSEIMNEMCPDGELRDSIRELAENEGAYIIVSSHGSTTDSALKDRRDAMRDAISDLDSPGDLETDFYDRNRIASWVRSHPSIILWVRRKVGNPITGWQSFGNWANCPQGVEEEYILDEDVRLYREPRVDSGGMTPLEGINTLRSSLSRSGEVRIAGLSGVGKTRLVQALFDERIGEDPLSKSQVFYTDVSDNPNPEPRRFAEQLGSLQSKTILIVDNCPPRMHRRLSKVFKDSDSQVSLLTVEYDIEEDQPEETEVFRLEAASEDLITELIKKRYDYIGSVEARQVADFSGGNARIAIALAETIERGESVAELKDKVLFERLFDQRNSPNDTLLKTAEVCSLVYSFDFRTQESEELEVLSRLANSSVNEIYSDVTELKRRGLVQERNHWRAVLPHAIANRLAKRALESIPLGTIRDEFETKAPKRLFKSFAHRLSYLHESETAVAIAQDWLSEEGFLGDVSNLNNDGIDVFKYIASVEPRATLNAIQRAADSEGGQRFTSRENRHFLEVTRILRLLAYDQDLFREAVDLLIEFALSEDEHQTNNSIRDILKSLFPIYLSGTHATARQRLGVIETLVHSNSEEKQQLGFSLLKEALKASRFISHYSFTFGARTRDFGFQPDSRDEKKEWFATFISFAKDLILSGHELSSDAKELLANKFRELWNNAEIFDELEEIAKEILENDSWKEGWVAVRSTIRFNKNDMGPELLGRLYTLEQELKPTDLEEQVKLYAFAKPAHSLSDTVEIEEGEKESDRYDKVMDITRDLGKAVAEDDSLFETFLFDMVCSEGGNLFVFGQGLAQGSSNPEKMWSQFREELKALDEDNRKFRVLRGFINALSESKPSLCEQILDEALDDEIFGSVFPLLQTSKKLDKKGADRLKKALDLDIAPLHLYRNLRLGGKVNDLNDEDLSKLLNKISKKSQGISIAVEIFEMKIHNHKKEFSELSDEIIGLGQDLLTKVEFKKKRDREITDYGLSLIVEGCLADKSAEDVARDFTSKLAEAIANLETYADSYKKVLTAIARIHPNVFMDCFLSGRIRGTGVVSFSPDSLGGNGIDPFSEMEDKKIINWCNEKPKGRYPVIASKIQPFDEKDDSEELEWTDLAYKLIKNTPDKKNILDQFLHSLDPATTGWVGSRADSMETKLPLLLKLQDHDNSEVSEWAAEATVKFKERIEEIREEERERERNRQNRAGFE
jgi:hypothetical protein